MVEIDRRNFLLGLAAAPAAWIESPKQSITERVNRRTFPSVFQAWNPADNMRDEDRDVTLARHDLVFHAPEFFGLRWKSAFPGLATEFREESITAGRIRRRSLLEQNPCMVFVAEIRYRDAPLGWLPPDHPWWKRDETGQPSPGWEEGGYLLLDFANRELVQNICIKCAACVQSGIVDGVMFDWWDDTPDRLHLLREVRAAIGSQALILVNANDRQTPKSAPYVNGYFMECYRSANAEDWRRIEQTLVWAESSLRRPVINCVETWFHHSRDDLALMRAVTTLVLTRSDGFCLFSDPNSLPTPDHLHNWYPFWDKSLGKPLKKGSMRADGSWERLFSGGMVVYNPEGNRPVIVELPSAARSTATGTVARRFEIRPCDGDLLVSVRE